MQTQQSQIGNERDSAIPILDQETADFNALIDEIWRRFTVRAGEIRRSENAFLIDFSTKW
jgi:hypothetical protein